MRVLLVTPYTPPLIGGLERVTATVARGLLAMGHEAAVVGQFASAFHPLRERFVRCEQERTFRIDEIPVSIVRPRWSPGIPGSVVYAMMWMPLMRRPVASLLGRAFREVLPRLAHGVDLVHYFGTGTETLGFAAATAAREAGAALVIQPAIHPGCWGDRALDADLYRRADVVLAFTRSEAAIIERLGVAACRVRTVPGSIAPPPATDPAGFRRRHGIAGPLVLFVGRKTEAKGVGRLLTAWPAVRARIPSARLVFIGPSAEWASPAMPPDGGVVDIADASEQEKHDALAACDLLCVPSVGESFGIAVFEAMSHGKPVVVADVPAMRESVGAAHAGLVIQPQPAAIADAVVALLGDAAAGAEMGQRGRALAARHTHDRALACYLDAYAAALNMRKA